MLYDNALINSIGEGLDCKCVATVLVVDDNEFNLLPLTLILQATYKIHCLKALNGAVAVELFRRDRQKRCCNVHIQLVLMDLVMPVLDGLSATVQIMDILREERVIKGCFDTRADKADPAKMAAEMGVSVVAITAYIDQPTVDKIFDCGMVEALQKPINSVLMEQIITKYYQQPTG